MWVLFNRSAKTRPVRDGHSFVDRCPECGERATFHEVEVSESVGVFFVSLFDDTERAYRCSACCEVFDLEDREVAAEIEKARVPTAAERRQAAEAQAIRIDDELAALKRRMGR